MARHKDKEWNLNDSVSWSDVHAALMMDIRDELKRLNRSLENSNVPGYLYKIANPVRPRRRVSPLKKFFKKLIREFR